MEKSVAADDFHSIFMPARDTTMNEKESGVFGIPELMQPVGGTSKIKNICEIG